MNCEYQIARISRKRIRNWRATPTEHVSVYCAEVADEGSAACGRRARHPEVMHLNVMLGAAIVELMPSVEAVRCARNSARAILRAYVRAVPSLQWLSAKGLRTRTAGKEMTGIGWKSCLRDVKASDPAEYGSRSSRHCDWSGQRQRVITVT